MFNWLRRRIALWGWFAYDFTKRLQIVEVNEYRSVHVHYKYNGDVEVTICNLKPFKIVATMSVTRPNLNEIEFKKYLQYEPIPTLEDDAQ